MEEHYRKLCAEKQREYDALSKQRLLVKFHMATPFLSVDYIRLDGILAYHSLLSIMGEDFYNTDPHVIDPIEAPLPLEKCQNKSDFWWWACSFGMYRLLDYESISGWKKRWCEENDDLVDFGKKKIRVDHKAGHFKAYAMPLIYRGAREIIFCGLGNAEKIEKLLRNVHHIGKKRSQGWGRVRKISIEITNANWFCWNEEKQATRAIPVGMEKLSKLFADMKPGNFHMLQCGYKPPYWHPRNFAWCYNIAKMVV